MAYSSAVCLGPGLGLSGLNLASDSGISIGAESEELSESDRDQLWVHPYHRPGSPY